MVNVKESRIIRSDPDKLWDFISQVEHFPKWLPSVIEAEIHPASNGTSGLGRQQILRAKTALGLSESLQKVIVWKPPRKITWEHLRDVIDGKEFTQAREIRTTFTISNTDGEVSFRMVGSWVPNGVSSQLMNRMMKRTVSQNFRKALDNLERIASEFDKELNAKQLK